MISEKEKQDGTLFLKGNKDKLNLQPDKFQSRVQEQLKQKYHHLSELKFTQVNDYGIFLEHDFTVFRVNMFIDSIVSPLEELQKEHKRFLQNLKLNNLESLKCKEYVLPHDAQSDNFEFYILEIEDKERVILNKVREMVKQDQKWKIEYSDLQRIWQNEIQDELDIIYYAFKYAKKTFLQKDKLVIKLKYSLLSNEGINLLFYCINRLNPFQTLILRLNKIKFTEEISKCFCKNLSDLSFLNKFHLILHDNDIKDDQMKLITQSIQKLTLLSNLKIDTWGNQIKNNGLLHVLNSVSQLKNLETLKLKIQQKKQLLKRINKINKMNSWQSEIDDIGTEYLKFLLPNFINLKYLLLNFYDNQITDEGCYNLGQGLKKMPQLIYLSLYLVDNQITSQKAVQHLKNSIQKSKRLCTFKLDY
ncbi:hypothetical protein ABPG74_011382 [Tetrahymena malaccensis]